MLLLLLFTLALSSAKTHARTQPLQLVTPCQAFGRLCLSGLTITILATALPIAEPRGGLGTSFSIRPLLRSFLEILEAQGRDSWEVP